VAGTCEHGNEGFHKMLGNFCTSLMTDRLQTPPHGISFHPVISVFKPISITKSHFSKNGSWYTERRYTVKFRVCSESRRVVQAGFADPDS
jgi:hypothetical protein